MTHELIRKHQAWRQKMLQSQSPHLGWPNRALSVRHGRASGLREEYPAILYHKPELDFDAHIETLRGRRLRRGLREVDGLQKAQTQPDGGRWITVHPHGSEEEGYPVYIVPNKDGSHSIVRGAGGKLNGMRLTHIKSPEEYKQLAKERRKQRVETLKLNEERLRQQMGNAAYEQHRLAKDVAGAQAQHSQRHAETDFIETVAQMQGVEPTAFALPPEALEGLDDKIAARLQEKAHQAALTWAKEVSDNVKGVVLSAYDHLCADSLGDLSVGDLANTATGDTGKGYQAQIAAMAQANGFNPQKRREGQTDTSWRGFLERSEHDLDEALSRQERVARLHAGAAMARAELRQATEQAAEQGAGPQAVRALETTPKVQNLGEAVAILTARKAMEHIHRQVADYNKELQSVEDASQLPKAAVVIGKPLSPEAALAAVAQSLSEEHAQKALTQLFHTAEQLDAAQGSLQAHYSVGQAAALNAICQAVDETSVDPLALDTLGVAGMTHVLAQRWKQQLPPDEFEAVKSALAEQHIATQEKIAREGVERAEGYLRDADRIPSDSQPTDIEGVEAALSEQAQKVELLRMAREAAGVARGRIEAAGTLNEALLHGKGTSVQISFGHTSTGDALERVYALGLTQPSRYDEQGNQVQEGEFTLHSDGENRILELHPKGVETLFAPVDAGRQERAAVSSAIKNGEMDDPDWLPAGISRRPATDFECNPLVVHSLDHPLRVLDQEDVPALCDKLREHIGAQLNEGRDPFTVVADLSSIGALSDLGLSAAGQARYQAALAQVAPSYYDRLRQQIADEIPAGLEPGSEAYQQAEVAARAKYARHAKSSTPEFQEGYAAHREALRTQLEGYADTYVDAQKARGILSPDDASLDKQRVPLDEATQDSLFRAVAADPRTQNAFLPLSEVNRDAVRSYALEHILGVDPKSQEILSPLSEPERRVFSAWQELKQQAGQGGIYAAIQEDMQKRQAEEGAGLFDDEPAAVSSLATVNLSEPASVLACARENAQALGYKLQVNPQTGKMDYLELQPGQKFYAEGEGGRTVEYSPLTEATIVSVARTRIKKKLKAHFVGQMQGASAVAESGFDPDSVLTASNRWQVYCKHVGGVENAIRTVQEFMAGDLQQRFAQHYQARTGKKIHLAQRPIAHADAHTLAVGNPEAAERQARAKQQRYSEVGKGRSGKFVSGSRKEKVEQQDLLEQEGPQLLGESAKGEHQVNVRRATLGKAIEGAIKGMMPYCPTDKAVEVASNITMAGKAINRQRATKLILHNKRQGLNLGAGSGKTICAMGAFTQARKEGSAHRALYVVPSNIVGQFGGEFLKFLDPSEGLRWHSDPTASPEERRQAMADSGVHMVVMTPESLREDVTKAVAQHLGLTPQATVKHMAGLPENELDDLVHGVMADQGWNFDFTMFDESHRLLSRAGKPDAHMARVGDSVGRKASHYIYSTADVVKNDASEAFSVLHKIDPARYPLSKQAAFQRKYGRNTLASGLALRAEMEPYIYTDSVDIGVSHERHTHLLPMSGAQRESYRGVMNAYQRAKTARSLGNTPGLLRALKELSPNSFTEKEPEHDTAQRLVRSLGTLKEMALNRVVNLHEDNAKMDWLAGNEERGVTGYLNEHKDEPTVIFAHNLDAVRAIRDRLREQGHSVATITGDMSSDAKNKAKLAFSPPSGEAKVNVLVCSDASAMGANLQRGHHLINFDTPQTSMLHEQRIAREVRQGQKNAVSVHDLVIDNDFEKRARRRLEQKRGLREITTSPVELLDDTGLMHRIQAARVRVFDKDV